MRRQAFCLVVNERSGERFCMVGTPYGVDYYYRMIFDTLQTVFNRLLISILPLGVSNLPDQFCLT